MATQQVWDMRFLRLAREIASWSKDPSTQVGAVITRPDRTVASVGYNGFPRQMPDRVENLLDRPQKYARTVHAEINALLHAGERISGYTLYTWPLLPCERCLVQLVQAGVQRFVSTDCPAWLLPRWNRSHALVRQFADEMNVVLYTYTEAELACPTP